MNMRSLAVVFAGPIIDTVDTGVGGSYQDIPHNKRIDHSCECYRTSILDIKDIYDDQKLSEAYHIGEDISTAFARTILTDCSSRADHIVLKNSRTPQELLDLWLLFSKVSFKPNSSLDLHNEAHLPEIFSSVNRSKREILLTAHAYMGCLFSLLRNRQFIITSENYIGLVPAAARTGDVIALIVGAKTPFALRPARDGKSFYLVEDC